MNTTRYRKNVGLIIINDQGKVLLCRRKKSNSWQFPQGGIDQGETPKRAAYREIYEEVNIKRNEIKFIGSTVLGDEIIGFTKIQKITNSMVFLICHLECKDKIIATASGIWKILKKPLPNAGFGG